MDFDRAQLKQQLLQARRLSDRVLGALRPGAETLRAIPARHRLVFYFGHLEAFDWNHIGRYGLDEGELHADFDRLFARGIDPPPGALPQDHASDWPPLAEVRHYMRRARARLDDLLDDAPTDTLNVAIEHRLMHVETLGYLLHQLEASAKQPLSQAPPAPAPAATQRWIEIPAGRVRLGRDPDSGFGWDNEFGRHEVELPGFAIHKFKLSNQDWLDYVRQGGEPAPFWRQRGERWRLATVFDEIDLPLAWPVWVDQRRALAYARDHGLALPSEAQWQRAAQFAHEPDAVRDNFGARRFDPVPVSAGARDDPRPHQMTGNGWEWTSSSFFAWPGFVPQAGYPGYSADFFDGEHFVLRGAAPLTHQKLVRPGFRNWFRPDYPFVHAGVRCVANR